MASNADSVLLDNIIAQCTKIIEAGAECNFCGHSHDQDVRFKAMERAMKAYALKNRTGAKKSGSAFDLGDADDE